MPQKPEFAPPLQVGVGGPQPPCTTGCVPKGRTGEILEGSPDEEYCVTSAAAQLDDLAAEVRSSSEHQQQECSLSF